MANNEGTVRPRGANSWRVAAWSMAGLLLLLPAVAMRFTDEVDWTASDFVFAAVLIGSLGLGIEFLLRRSSSPAYRAGAVAALFTIFLTIWANGAVGMIGDEDNPYNLLFLGVVLIALAGTALARFRPAGMARTMVAAALVQAAAGAGGLALDPLGAILSIAFAGPWLLAAALFHTTSRE